MGRADVNKPQDAFLHFTLPPWVVISPALHRRAETRCPVGPALFPIAPSHPAAAEARRSFPYALVFCYKFSALAKIASMKNVFTMILAGGRGERLHPLTDQRAKPAVPFGGKYLSIYFTLSNCINSGLRNVTVLIQYKSHSLDRHIRRAWNMFNPELGEYITSLPPQQRISQDWYKGTADAVFQNWFIVEDERPEYLLILGGDHVYKMNYKDMYSFLQQKQADVVVGAIEYSLSEASSFGVIAVNNNSQIIGWQEKPKDPSPIPNDPDRALCSMGIYLFRTSCLQEQLVADAERDSSHDFGKDIIPGMIEKFRVFAYNFRDENRKAVKYWRDVGTLDAYWEANMDLVSVDPLFNLYDRNWPIRTYQGQYPPAKFVFAEEGDGGRLGVALASIN